MKVVKGKIVLSEKEIRKQVRGYLKLIGHKDWWWNMGGVLSYRGLSDWVILRGGHIYIEFKKMGAKLRPDQKKFNKMLHRHGQVIWIIRSLDQFIRLWERYKP